jgi:short-subunit dehydrogenase
MNKLIVVTGGTKGIGRAIVEKFASQGFDVVTCARNGKDLASLKADVERLHGVTVHIHAVDMADQLQVKAFCEKILQLERTIAVLVNNAGFFIPGEITTEEDGALQKMIEGNLYSAYR